jgi:hypothetical protein
LNLILPCIPMIILMELKDWDFISNKSVLLDEFIIESKKIWMQVNKFIRVRLLLSTIFIIENVSRKRYQ